MRLVLLGFLIAMVSSMASAAPVSTSHYVPGADGVRLAVDVWSSETAAPGPAPAVVQFTRYWRSYRSGAVMEPETVAAFTRAGYRVVIVDVRGTGASFGTRNTEFSDAEVADFSAVFDWIVSQPWSNGRLATLGSSYLGNTAELAAMTSHPALRAVVPRFSDFSAYGQAVRPGGVRNSVIAAAWPAFIQALDRNDACAAFMGATAPDCPPNAPWFGGVRPVNDDEAALARAIAEHAGNAGLDTILDSLVFSDDSFAGDGDRRITLDAVSPARRWRKIDAANVPAYHWASWFDGGTADGVLTRFTLYQSPMHAIIGAWTHGGGRRADPFSGPEAAGHLTHAEQIADILKFLDPLVKDDARPRPGRELRYFMLGTNSWRTTDTWPPRGVELQRWHFRKERQLSTDRPLDVQDVYKVDFTASTGLYNRWHTQLGQAVDYGDRAHQGEKLLAYTSQPLRKALEIVGTPFARIALTANNSDGALFVYLEAILPNGRVIYVTEGQRRLMFNRAARFTRAEATKVRPGRETIMNIPLNPIAIQLPEGARLRVSIAGADAETFEKLPADNVSVSYAIAHARSYIDLPAQLRE